MANSATSSRFVIEAARPEDDAELRALLRQMPMGQAIEVTFERGRARTTTITLEDLETAGPQTGPGQIEYPQGGRSRPQRFPPLPRRPSWAS